MIYRLSTGARSGWKKHIVSGLLIFGITAGFPVVGSLLNFDRFFVSPSDVAGQQGGSVLGESTEVTPVSSDNSPDKDEHASQNVNVKPVPASRPLNVEAERQPLQTPAAEVPETAAGAEVDTPAGDASASTDPEAEPALEVEVLDVIDIQVTPPTL